MASNAADGPDELNGGGTNDMKVGGNEIEINATVSTDVASFNKAMIQQESELNAQIEQRSSAQVDAFNMKILTDSLPPVFPSFTQAPAPHVRSVEEATKRLREIDERRHVALTNVPAHLSAIQIARLSYNPYGVITSLRDLRADEAALSAFRDEVSLVDVGKDKTNITFRDDLIKDLDGFLDKIRSACSLGKANPTKNGIPPQAHFIDTSKMTFLRLRRMHYITLVPMLLIVALSIFAHVSNAYANASLRIFGHFLPMVISHVDSASGSNAPSAQASAAMTLVGGIPKDIRTLKDRLSLSIAMHTFAVCPLCSKVYEPIKLKDGKMDFPRNCSNRTGKRQVLCKGVVAKDAVVDGVVCRIPAKPYYIQDFDAFKAQIIMNPFMEVLLRRGQACSEKTEMVDIKDGKRLQSILGPDGGLFMDANSDELRLAWNISGDWANPFFNKSAGKHASVGSIAATCLNLPPLYRYNMENVYLASIVPGPKEAKKTEIIEYLDPIVDIFLHSYEHGTYYSSTYMHPEGVLERSIVAALVCDTPGARKCGGMGSCTTAKNMCHVCRMTMDELHVMDLSKPCYRPRNLEQHRRDAETWREMTGITERENHVKATGVRWSPFLRLPYWDPQKCIIIDGMHNLFLGLVLYHCRSFLGIEVSASEEESSQPESDLKPSYLTKVRRHLKSGSVSVNIVNSLSSSVLEHFCHEFGIETSSSTEEDESTSSSLLRKALLAHLQVKSDDNEGQKTSAADDQHPGTDLGEVFAGNDVGEVFGAFRMIPSLSKHDILFIQKSIQDTKRPRSHKGPPLNLGEKGHGKLKADQWRSCIEFDIPVALVKLFVKGAIHEKLVRSTMFLAIAIRYATSHKMSEHRINRYSENMLNYLKSILEIDPMIKLRPNHHNALHIGDYLRLYGPMHGWWMFVFERVIGKWQQTNTNSRLGGELERTLLEDFATGSILKSIFKHPDAGEVISEIGALLKLSEDQRGSLFADRMAGAPFESVLPEESDFASPISTKAKKLVRLEPDIYKAFERLCEGMRREFNSTDWIPPQDVMKQSDITINGELFSTAASSSSNFVFCESGPKDRAQYWPSDIHQIFSVQQPGRSDRELHFLVLKAYRRAPVETIDPFRTSYPDFGASLWDRETYSEPFIVPVLSSLKICHGIKTSWDDKLLVMKPLLRDF